MALSTFFIWITVLNTNQLSVLQTLFVGNNHLRNLYLFQKLGVNPGPPTFKFDATKISIFSDVNSFSWKDPSHRSYVCISFAEPSLTTNWINLCHLLSIVWLHVKLTHFVLLGKLQGFSFWHFQCFVNVPLLSYLEKNNHISCFGDCM